jgi:hypothetical protein
MQPHTVTWHVWLQQHLPADSVSQQQCHWCKVHQPKVRGCGQTCGVYAECINGMLEEKGHLQQAGMVCWQTDAGRSCFGCRWWCI